MRNIRDGYVHRGDRIRRREKIRRWVLGLGVIGGLALIMFERQRDANASASTFTFGLGESSRIQSELEQLRGELEIHRAQLQRAEQVMAFSGRYKIGADLAAAIYDIALAEGLEPELAFRVVRIESQFNERATSPVGAIGLTQLMPATAKYFDRKVTKEKLYHRETNLRIGFRYLRALITENKGDVPLALVIYNRGPVAVQNAVAQGLDPRNGYERIVMKGYNGRGVVD
ncbi:MAG TPA: transglycosylase SLT domain-containing protein [Gemmatimonadaceae bacterium]|jgi:soluble lytic murein transglycosylase-like protein|nr:transglycosylase SLT domain-containing protein [Gemmatimonadaceae bacterium]